MEPFASPELVLRRSALAEGWSDDELDRQLRRGELARLRPGAYASAAATRDPGRRHRHLVTATLAGLRRPAVVSHQSAAVLLGLPMWGAPLGRVHVTRNPPAPSEVGRHLHCHAARLSDDVVTVGGVAVTSPMRTALDLARTLPFEAAVATLDAMLFRGKLDGEILAGRVEDLGRVPGARAAVRAVRFADGRSESVGESRSRVLLHRLGLAPSTLQIRIDAPGAAVVIGRADFAWEDERVIGEFDGRVKYGRLLRPGQDPGDVVFEEKRREDAIRDEDWGAVRWTWSELTPQVLGPRVERALDRGRRRRG